MNIVIISILALLGLGVLAAIASKLSGNKGGNEEEQIVKATNDCSTCSGESDACEQVCMMEAATKAPVYFDDEELDIYKGRPADSYTDEEADAFSEIMYTMRPEEVKEWNRSLILRGINVPNQLKDELIALIHNE